MLRMDCWYGDSCLNVSRVNNYPHVLPTKLMLPSLWINKDKKFVSYPIYYRNFDTINWLDTKSGILWYCFKELCWFQFTLAVSQEMSLISLDSLQSWVLPHGCQCSLLCISIGTKGTRFETVWQGSSLDILRTQTRHLFCIHHQTVERPTYSII